MRNEGVTDRDVVALETKSAEAGFEFAEIESRLVPDQEDGGCSKCAGCDGCGLGT